MSTSVRAKFAVTSVEEFSGGKNVRFSAVTTGSDENKSWSQYTPSGELTMGITNPAAEQFFEVGQEYYLDFTKA
jgi:hypothetical protein